MISSKALQDWKYSFNNTGITIGANDSSLVKVDRKHIIAILTLYDNSLRMGSGNNNVEIATVDPSIWLPSLMDCILDNVDYVTKTPAFQFFTVKDDKFVTILYDLDEIVFDKFELIEPFIIEKGKFSTLVIFSIVQMVDLTNLKTFTKLKYKEIIDIEKSRDRKIEYITKTETNE